MLPAWLFQHPEGRISGIAGLCMYSTINDMAEKHLWGIFKFVS
jgi:hypothetical protein